MQAMARHKEIRDLQLVTRIYLSLIGSLMHFSRLSVGSSEYGFTQGCLLSIVVHRINIAGCEVSNDVVNALLSYKEGKALSISLCPRWPWGAAQALCYSLLAERNSPNALRSCDWQLCPPYSDHFPEVVTCSACG